VTKLKKATTLGIYFYLYIYIYICNLQKDLPTTADVKEEKKIGDKCK